MKNILLPTDFSENSKNAVTYAFDFFKGTACVFYFLNTQKITEYTTSDLYTASSKETVYDAILSDNKQQLHTFVNELEKKYAIEDFRFISIVDFDTLTDSINQAVNTYDIDLIIMGSNGATGAEEIVFGSNTLKVIRQVDCPLLVIPEGFKLSTIEIILYTIHNHQLFDIDKLKPLINIMNLHDPLLKVLEINDQEINDKEEEDFQNQLNQFFKNSKTEYYKVTGVSVATAVDTFVQLIDVNIHASVIEKESFLKRFMKGSEVSKLSYSSKIPLLILHK